MLTTIGDMLKRLNYEVTTVDNGKEACRKVESGRFDMIITDLNMPVMDGLEATRTIRRREAEAGASRLRIVAMTANAMQGDREKCVAAGMDDYLSKPFEVEDLELAPREDHQQELGTVGEDDLCEWVTEEDIARFAREARAMARMSHPNIVAIHDSGQAGDNIGCLLRGIERDEIERGQVLAKAGSINPHTKFTARVYVLTKEEGGRHTPFYNGYRPQFYLRTTDVTGAISLKEGAEMIMPGDHVDMDVELITPIAIEVGQRFAIREGGRTVGAGVINAVEE